MPHRRLRRAVWLMFAAALLMLSVPVTAHHTNAHVPVSLVIDVDTTLTNQTLTLRPGDSIEFRNGARLTIGSGASVDWQGTPTTTWSNDGLTQNLDRDVDLFGSGDVMFSAGSLPSTLRYVEINLRPLPLLGRYPLHWHHVADGSRGTLIEGVVVRNSTNRAFVPHASHGITFRDTIAKTIAGPAYWWDAPPSSFDQSNNSEDILYDHALADGITNAVGDNRGFRLNGFTLGAGIGNTVRDSVARNINPTHVKSCSGFEWPEVSIHQPTVWTFINNKTFLSRCHGIFVWQNTDQIHIVDGFISDKGIEHGAYVNFYEYRNVQVPYVIVHAIGWSVTGGSIGEVRTTKHQNEGTVTFTDVGVGRLIIRNAENGGIKPGHYVFTNTGLTCPQVTWAAVVPGTTVTIDGAVC